MKKGLHEITACINCGYAMEKDRHVLFDCKFLREVWNNLSNGKKWIHISALSFKNLLYSITSESNIEDIALFATSTGLIWYFRNNLKYVGICSSPETVAL